NIALFYCLVGPNGSLRSLTRDYWREERPHRVADALILRLFQFNVCIVYATAAIAKSRSTSSATRFLGAGELQAIAAALASYNTSLFQAYYVGSRGTIATFGAVALPRAVRDTRASLHKSPNIH
ncbi:MAG: hypothetical protein ACXVAW_13505, partial [Vulcanimicrobiaceae bacterium]